MASGAGRTKAAVTSGLVTVNQGSFAPSSGHGFRTVYLEDDTRRFEGYQRPSLTSWSVHSGRTQPVMVRACVGNGYDVSYWYICRYFTESLFNTKGDYFTLPYYKKKGLEHKLEPEQRAPTPPPAAKPLDSPPPVTAHPVEREYCQAVSAPLPPRPRRRESLSLRSPRYFTESTCIT